MKIVKTEDASFTLYSEQYGEHYHSLNGALNESQHIYIGAGLNQVDASKINVFEMGFGTGLNAYLTALFAEKHHREIHYITVEKHPLEVPTFFKELPEEYRNPLFEKIHQTDWEQTNNIHPKFSLLKHKADICDYKHQAKYHLVYYDAFSPDSQPDLWTADIFKSIFDAMHPSGILVTYSVKGDVKRALKSVGFKIEKLPGPKGKREILRAIKVENKDNVR